MAKKPLVDNRYLLQKFPGKGGWTYAAVPEIKQDKKAPFGWVKVKGWIDGYELKQVKLMPMGDGKTLFVPVKAAIRKKLGKQAGDYVQIILFPDDSKVIIPAEILECFANEDGELYQTFHGFSDGEKKAYLDWIYGAKKEETRISRIVKMMERLSIKLKFYDKEKG